MSRNNVSIKKMSIKNERIRRICGNFARIKRIRQLIFPEEDDCNLKANPVFSDP